MKVLSIQNNEYRAISAPKAKNIAFGCLHIMKSTYIKDVFQKKYSSVIKYLNSSFTDKLCQNIEKAFKGMDFDTLKLTKIIKSHDGQISAYSNDKLLAKIKPYNKTDVVEYVEVFFDGTNALSKKGRFRNNGKLLILDEFSPNTLKRIRQTVFQKNGTNKKYVVEYSDSGERLRYNVLGKNGLSQYEIPKRDDR